MNNMFVKTGDTVVLLTGDEKYRGKKGKVIVEGINVVKKHVKPRKAGDPSGIIETESAIYASKVQVVCPKCDKATRVAHKIDENGNKTRVCKHCGAEL